jgi:hypothetical protein
MATFSVWAKNRPVRRVAWVCGPQSALVAEVVAAHRDGAPDGQAVTLYAGDQPERDIWDLLLSCPVSGGRRAVVYGAEMLARTGNVPELAEAPELGTAFAVLVSAEDDFPRDGGKLAPHLAALQASKNGQLIRCCEPGKLDDRIALVASWWPGASPVFAHSLLDRCGSLDEAWQACRTARLAGLKPEPAMAAAVCPRSPAGDFADCLIAGDKTGAMAAARELDFGEIGAVIGLTAFRLALAEAVADGLRDGLSPREAAARAPGPRFAALQVSRHASRYSSQRARRCREALARADAALRSGAPAGVAESLVAGW